MAKFTTLRYVTWPRDEIRTMPLEEGKHIANANGLVINLTKQTTFFIPWSSVVDITKTEIVLQEIDKFGGEQDKFDRN